MGMSWCELLSDLRSPKPGMEKPSKPNNDKYRSPFEADYDRIVYSTPFRRLARKTQVHPLALNDHVHTRLTHSLEVASVGRSLGQRLAQFLRLREELPSNICESDIKWIMQSACLAHDIGNPPFGHAGEFAIREWVSTHSSDVFGEKSADISDGIKNDWILFEGNAQGFRLAARGDNPFPGYLRLTYASLGAMIKYPWSSDDLRAEKKRKFNVFSSEIGIFKSVAHYTGMERPDGRVARHPMSFLTEAADDICYRILDLEDAVVMGILDKSEAVDIYSLAIGSKEWNSHPLEVLRGKAIESLIESVWSVFEADYANIMAGQRESDLKKDLSNRLKEAINKINFTYERIFSDRTKVAAEMGAYKALGRIIKALCHATHQLAIQQDFQKASFLTQRCLNLAWGNEYAKDNMRKSYDWWLHQVMDYVSGLTDNYARQISREIEGT